MGFHKNGRAVVSKNFRQSQAFLHTWSGLLLGWLLFVIFVAGTIAFAREGLNRWMRPELPRVEDPLKVVAGAQAFLQRTAPDAKSWYITVPSRQSFGSQLFWAPQPDTSGGPPRRGGRRDNQALIAGDGQRVTVRETRGGEFFYRFHFDLHYMPVIWARWLVGFATMMMLVAILSGVVTHKKIFKDFFTLRRNKGQRSWLDGHNATAVLALPFHLMITYTGLVTLMAMLMPWAVVANYEEPASVYETLFPQAETAGRTGEAAPLLDLAEIVRDGERRLGGPVAAVQVAEPGDRAARITLHQSPSSMISTRTPSLTYDGVTGKIVWQSPPPGGAAVTAGVMVGLHAGRFAETGLRWIYYLCGVAGSLMIASGLVLWIVKRREKLPDPARPYFGFRLVEKLNIAVVAGFPLGVAVMFWANRLLPADMTQRAQWEIHCLFIAWGLALLLALFVPARRAWAGLLAGTGLLLAALPFYNSLWTAKGIYHSLADGDGMFVAIDATVLVTGIALLMVAVRVARYRPPVRRGKRAGKAGTQGKAVLIAEEA